MSVGFSAKSHPPTAAPSGALIRRSAAITSAQFRTLAHTCTMTTHTGFTPNSAYRTAITSE
jgi:hypothetical protein